MKAWSEERKAIARRLFGRGPLRPMALTIWNVALGIEMKAAALLQSRQVNTDLSAVTAVIKTFERPHRLEALIASIRRVYPALKLVVVDDSREPRDWEGCETVRLPFDSGVGAGRAAGLARVATPYVLNLDDDFLFGRATRVEEAVRLLDSYPMLDLIGGQVIDLPLFITHDFRRAALRPTSAMSRITPGTRFGPVEIMDKVPNFFLARTEAVRSVGWDPQLKRLDHGDFFARAKGRLVSGLWEDFAIFHLRDPFDEAYAAHRFDLDADLALLNLRYPG